MIKLYVSATIGGLAGVLICVFAVMSWPKSGYLTAGDPSVNVAWLSVGGALIGAGVLSLLLAFHAEAVTEDLEKKYLDALQEHARRQEKRAPFSPSPRTSKDPLTRPEG